MVLSNKSSIANIKLPADCIGQTCAVRLSGIHPTIYIGKVLAIKNKAVIRDGECVTQEWAQMQIPGQGKKWVPASWFVTWVWA